MLRTCLGARRIKISEGDGIEFKSVDGNSCITTEINVLLSILIGSLTADSLVPI